MSCQSVKSTFRIDFMKKRQIILTIIIIIITSTHHGVGRITTFESIMENQMITRSGKMVPSFNSPCKLLINSSQTKPKPYRILLYRTVLSNRWNVPNVVHLQIIIWNTNCTLYKFVCIHTHTHINRNCQCLRKETKNMI